MVVCTICLRKESREQRKQRWSVAVVGRFGAAIAGFVLCWLFFLGLGKVLVTMPSKFHEGTIWQISTWDEQP